MLGIDPLHVANEGKLVAVVPAAEADDGALARCTPTRWGCDAAPHRRRPAPIRTASQCWRRRSAAPGFSTCSSATHCPGSAEEEPMRFVDEYRDPAAARALSGASPSGRGTAVQVHGGVRRPHPHDLPPRHRAVLPQSVELVHGPGCPVCVIPMGRVDDAIAVAETTGVIFTSFGDMMRVPGGHGTLLEAKARGADVRFVYSPLDALRIAAGIPTDEVVFFAVGFETTAPSTAVTLLSARDDGVQQLQRVLQPCDDRAAHQGHPRVARPASGWLPRPRSRVDRDREPPVPLRAQALRQAAGDRWLRTARHPAVRSAMLLDPAPRRPVRGREPVHAGSFATRAIRWHCRCSPRCSSCGPTSSGAGSGSSPRAR